MNGRAMRWFRRGRMRATNDRFLPTLTGPTPPAGLPSDDEAIVPAFTALDLHCVNGIERLLAGDEGKQAQWRAFARNLSSPRPALNDLVAEQRVSLSVLFKSQ